MNQNNHKINLIEFSKVICDNLLQPCQWFSSRYRILIRRPNESLLQLFELIIFKNNFSLVLLPLVFRHTLRACYEVLVFHRVILLLKGAHNQDGFRNARHQTRHFTFSRVNDYFFPESQLILKSLQELGKKLIGSCLFRCWRNQVREEFFQYAGYGKNAIQPNLSCFKENRRSVEIFMESIWRFRG